MKRRLKSITNTTYREWIAKLLVFVIIFSGFQFIGGVNQVDAATNESETRILNYADSPADNPIKGFVGYQGAGSYSDFPLSMEFIIMPMSEIVVGEGQYDWSVLENNLNQVASYGRQSIVSFYLDNPGTEIGKDAIPKYLLDNGLKVTEYTMWSEVSLTNETGYSPDYSNQELWDMIFDFVNELGAKYDGDVRIGDIEASIVGFWGEWHTAPYEFGLEDSDLIQLAKAYDNTFNKTQITIRYPKEGTNLLDVGYSDYSFCYESIVEPWSQLNRLKQYNATEYWKKNIGGGELMPQYVSTIFETENWSLRDGESYEECLQALHPSWLLVGSVQNFTGNERNEAIKAARKLGYDFTITEATFANDITSSKDKMNVSLKIKNNGVAPFYYNWQVRVGLLDESGDLIKAYGTDWDITQIAADGKEYVFSGVIPNLSLEDGKYSLAISVQNPLINGKKLRFANETQRSDGWMVLGDFTVNGYISEEDDEIEEPPTAREKYGLNVSATDFSEVLLVSDDYFKIGVRIRNYGTSTYSGSDKPMMNIYKDRTLVKKITTDWNISKIKPDTNNYFSWYIKGLGVGEYEIKLQLTSDTAEISMGKLYIVNSLEDVNQIDDRLADCITKPDVLPTAREKYNLDVTETYYSEEIVLSNDYFKVGVRIRNYGTSNYTGSDNPVMKIYNGGTLVKYTKTDWNLSKINPNVNYYFCWFIRGLDIGEYDIKLQLTTDTAEVFLGKIKIIKETTNESKTDTN